MPQELANGVAWVGILPGAVGLPGPAPCRPLDQMSPYAPPICRQPSESMQLIL
ncbi:hypothetical protein DMR_01240 [Solidesulfovibrio magneticus RS-1]|uniref:Uncharacterized protein n=1 Tax=Solidesulfovibrio magneticus (strain ATCC 700980 / DSM 13731 / RS-1) TaxID=573370 RepID=C4XTV0_SOLM1|nr:hypothetical protein DMR_01240 [Solidesulfovibrio magneticus RS-1]